jgi:dTDP-4-dehydrorhamnose reductase
MTAMSDAEPRVLVLGATGMLGHEALRVLGSDFQVEGTARDPEAARALGIDVPLHQLDAAEPADLAAALDAARPDVVVNCVGIVKQLDAASQPVPSITVNSLFPHRVAVACVERGARAIHVSTDCVFSGERPAPGAYGEDDLPDARDLYGRSKLLGEVGAPALTLRTSIIGWELERASGLLGWLVSQAGNEIRGFANAWFSGLTTEALAGVIARVIREAPELAGLYHVSSEPISKLDLVTALDRALGLGCTIVPADEPHVNRVLDSSRFRSATGIEAPGWEEMIASCAKEGRRESYAR